MRNRHDYNMVKSNKLVKPKVIFLTKLCVSRYLIISRTVYISFQAKFTSFFNMPPWPILQSHVNYLFLPLITIVLFYYRLIFQLPCWRNMLSKIVEGFSVFLEFKEWQHHLAVELVNNRS